MEALCCTNTYPKFKVRSDYWARPSHYKSGALILTTKAWVSLHHVTQDEMGQRQVKGGPKYNHVGAVALVKLRALQEIHKKL